MMKYDRREKYYYMAILDKEKGEGTIAVIFRGLKKQKPRKKKKKDK